MLQNRHLIIYKRRREAIGNQIIRLIHQVNSIGASQIAQKQIIIIKRSNRKNFVINSIIEFVFAVDINENFIQKQTTDYFIVYFTIRFKPFDAAFVGCCFPFVFFYVFFYDVAVAFEDVSYVVAD